MSTILNSLKKSSDERNENSKSSIDNFNFGSAKNSRRSQSFIVMILLISLTVVIGYFGYQYLNSEEGVFEGKVLLENDEVMNPKVISENLAIATEETKEAVKEKIQKPDSNDVKQRIQESKNRNLSAEENSPSTADKQALETAREPETGEITQQVNTKIDGAQSNQTQSTTIKTPEVQKQPQLTLTMPGEESNQTPVDQVKKQKYLYVYQLPFSVRKDIPEIKLNIHVYDKDPDNRIAIINGVKLSVGDLIENEILLKEIIHEGIVLEINDSEFMIPK